MSIIPFRRGHLIGPGKRSWFSRHNLPYVGKPNCIPVSAETSKIQREACLAWSKEQLAKKKERIRRRINKPRKEAT